MKNNELIRSKCSGVAAVTYSFCSLGRLNVNDFRLISLDTMGKILHS